MLNISIPNPLDYRHNEKEIGEWLEKFGHLTAQSVKGFDEEFEKKFLGGKPMDFYFGLFTSYHNLFVSAARKSPECKDIILTTLCWTTFIGQKILSGDIVARKNLKKSFYFLDHDVSCVNTGQISQLALEISDHQMEHFKACLTGDKSCDFYDGLFSGYLTATYILDHINAPEDLILTYKGLASFTARVVLGLRYEIANSGNRIDA